jgi:hypothetical protein
MRKKQYYARPECETVAFQAGNLICASETSDENEGVKWGGGY